jgi:penicillin-binding protein 2
VSDEELQRPELAEYYPGDYLGKSGVERSHEKTLHGMDGGRQIEVDARGRFLRTVSESSPVVGNSVMLTIDHVVQKAAEAAFGQQAGAAVLMDVRTGEILAFASNPVFDPALFAGRMPPDKWKEYMEDPRHPLENKALKGQYPPGSTFKIVTALAGLEEGLITEQTTVYCNGAYKMGRDTFRCWSKGGHGAVNLHKALRESCDVYFYQLGERLGVDRLASHARKFALGSPLGIDLDNEKGGNIPTTAWKEKRFRSKWLRGETPPVSIGQGYVLMTPIQLASMAATVANGGDVHRPYLVRRILDPEGKVLKEFNPQLLMKSGFSPRNIKLVNQGLLAVVNEPGGTGGAARLGEVRVAGKTGTSQVVKQKGKGPTAYKFRDHALFVAFAPFENPEVAVAVVVEHGGHGGSAAAPIAGRILRSYFETKGVIRRPVSPAVKDEGEQVEGQEQQTPPATPPQEGSR